jgi:hypothetical protein
MFKQSNTWEFFKTTPSQAQCSSTFCCLQRPRKNHFQLDFCKFNYFFSSYDTCFNFFEGLSTQKNPRTPSDFFKKIPKKSQKSKNQKIPKIPKFQEFWFNKSTKFYKNRFFSLSILIPLTVLIIPLGLLSVSWSVCCQCHARNF